jgi:hypothetical protein
MSILPVINRPLQKQVFLNELPSIYSMVENGLTPIECAVAIATKCGWCYLAQPEMAIVESIHAFYLSE